MASVPTTPAPSALAPTTRTAEESAAARSRISQPLTCLCHAGVRHISLTATLRVVVTEQGPGSEFPPDWTDRESLDEVASVARRPDEVRYQPATKRRSARYIMVGSRGGVRIKVVVDLDGSIVTGYPLNGPGVVRNPK